MARPLTKRGAPLTERVLTLCKENDDGCWVWLGKISAQGYGQMYTGKRSQQAHRASYEAFAGAIQDGLVIDHLCSNRACVNPDHLEAVTQSENVRRATSKITHCAQGHPYDLANTRMTPAGHRVCRRCRASYSPSRRYDRDQQAQIADIARAGMSQYIREGCIAQELLDAFRATAHADSNRTA